MCRRTDRISLNRPEGSNATEWGCLGGLSPSNLVRPVDSRFAAASIACCLELSAQVGRAEIPLAGGTLAVRNAASAADCVEEAALGARIAALLTGGAPFDPKAPPWRFDVTIQSTSSGFVAELRVSGKAHGLRQIDAEHCQGLTDALAVTVAIVLDQQAREDRLLTPQARAATQQNTTTSHDEFATESHATPERAVASRTMAWHPTARQSIVVGPVVRAIDLRPSTELRAWVGAGFGTTKSWDIESGLASFDRGFGLAVGAFWQPTHETGLGKGRVQVMTIGATVAGCLRIGKDWRGVLCLRSAVGGKRVQGLAFDTQAPRIILPVLHLGPTLGVETGRRWVFGVDLVGQVAFFRDSYTVDNYQEKLTPPIVAAWLVARIALSNQEDRH
jgi:hypothetical protein